MPGVPWLIRVESLSDSDSAAARPAAAGQRRRAPCTPGAGGPGGQRHGFRITFQVNHDSDLIIESRLIGTSHLKTWPTARVRGAGAAAVIIRVKVAVNGKFSLAAFQKAKGNSDTGHRN